MSWISKLSRPTREEYFEKFPNSRLNESKDKTISGKLYSVDGDKLDDQGNRYKDAKFNSINHRDNVMNSNSHKNTQFISDLAYSAGSRPKLKNKTAQKDNTKLMKHETVGRIYHMNGDSTDSNGDSYDEHKEYTDTNARLLFGHTSVSDAVKNANKQAHDNWSSRDEYHRPEIRTGAKFVHINDIENDAPKNNSGIGQSNWFDSLTMDEKVDYLKRHPNSKFSL